MTVFQRTAEGVIAVQGIVVNGLRRATRFLSGIPDAR